MTNFTTGSAGIPSVWMEKLQQTLMGDEQVIAALSLEMDEMLQFRDGILVVTNKRLLSTHADDKDWLAYDFATGVTLDHRDRSSIVYLDLFDQEKRLAHWCFMGSQKTEIRELIADFTKALDSFVKGKPLKPATLHPLNADTLVPATEHHLVGTEEESASEKTNVSALFRIWRFAKNYKLPLFLSFFCAFVGTAANLVPPYLTRPLIDDVLIPAQAGQAMNIPLIQIYLGALFLSMVVAWAFNWAKSYIISKVSERIAFDMRVTAYKHLLSLSHEFFTGNRTGDLLTRIGKESDSISVFISLHMVEFVTDVMMLCMIIPVLFMMNPWLALVTLLPLPFLFWMIYVIRNRLRTAFQKTYRVWAEVTNILSDTIPGIRVVKSFGQETFESERFHVANIRNLRENDKLNKIWALFTPSVSLASEIGLLFVWAFGIYQVSQSAIQVGVLVAFISYLGRFYGRIESMTNIMYSTQNAVSASKRIFSILDHVSKVPEPVKPVHLENVKGLIEINDLHFSYGNKEVYKGINVKIQPGEMVGIVGESGAGKSTLINLICRLFDVSKGSITLDGVNIKDIPIQEYRRSIGLVAQDPYLFYGTIADNIAYGKPGATREEIIEAARAAYAHDFIMKLPQGYDSMVGERGQFLSIGQCQRITIARALLIDPPILIFDEATSALDSQSENEVQKALVRLFEGRTTLTIAHRLSTLRHANRIIVLNHGEIAEEGSHAELIEKKGLYFRNYQLWSGQK